MERTTHGGSIMKEVWFFYCYDLEECSVEHVMASSFEEVWKEYEKYTQWQRNISPCIMKGYIKE